MNGESQMRRRKPRVKFQVRGEGTTGKGRKGRRRVFRVARSFIRRQGANVAQF